MAHIKRKYIDSHWLVFIFQGAIAMLFGCLTLFTSDSTSAGLVPVIGIFLLALAIVEFANSIYRSYNRQGWAVSTAVAVFDAIFGVLLLFIINEGMTWHLVLIAAYTCYAVFLSLPSVFAPQLTQQIALFGASAASAASYLAS